MEQNKPQTATTQQLSVAEQRGQLFELISTKINDLIGTGGIVTPPEYNVSNALRSAWLMLTDQKDKNDKPVLEVCTAPSIANALFKMVVQGMNPAKAQCYFIPYGNQLTFQRSYMGSYALAKRVSDLKEVNAVLIYENDVFSYDIDTATGRKKILEHTQKFENIDITKIKGGYAILVFNDGTTDVVIMTMDQIKKSWEQGQTKGTSKAHVNFTDEMALKTIRSRAVKLIINSSDDSYLMQEDESKDEAKASADHKFETEANAQVFEIKEIETQEEQPIIKPVEEQKKTEAPDEKEIPNVLFPPKS